MNTMRSYLVPKMFWGNLALGISLLLGVATAVQAKTPPEFTKGVREFTQNMIASGRFDPKWVRDLMGSARYQQKIIDAISRPAEGKAWSAYRKIFVTERRIVGGTAFWNKHQRTLARAEQTFGVPAKVIVSIIGVETNYGGNTGGYRVIDALSTLAFAYPKRAEFFRKQLEEFLQLIHDERLNGWSLKGSYAGAIGLPQFMPDSWRNYAVDFDGDGRRDLANSEEDAIGSVANYLARHGWQEGESITTMVIGADAARAGRFVDAGMKPSFTIAELESAGIRPRSEIPATAEASLVRLEGEGGDEYWAGLGNFYAITRYNHSNLYAMAVFQLGEEIEERRGPRESRQKPAPLRQPNPGQGAPSATAPRPIISKPAGRSGSPSFLD